MIAGSLRCGFLLLLSAHCWEIGLAQTADQVTESLKRSQFCARAAKEFMERPEFKNDPLADSRDYTSHFNKSLGKCLVQVRSLQMVPKSTEFVEFNHVYDALEGRTLGGKILTKKREQAGETVLKILLVKDGRFIRDRSEAATALIWFDSLMND